MTTIRRRLAVPAALLLSAALALSVPLSASAVPTPVSGPTTGGTIVSDLLPGARFTAVSGGFNFTSAVASDGRIYAWGDNQLGQLGRGTTSSVQQMAPVHTPAGVTFTEVYGGVEFALAIGSDGNTYAWGDNEYGQLGDGTRTSTSTPVRVATPPGITFTRLSVGYTHVLALGSDGNTYAWGANPLGTLGDGTLVDRLTPVRVLTPEGLTFTAVAAGAYHSVALASDGTLYSWGRNNYGQLGDGGIAIQRATPAPVNTPPGSTFTSVSSGIESSAALATDGTVYSWGQNESGQLGDGSLIDRATPVLTQLPAGAVVTQLGMGGYHTAILTADGSMWAWGDNRAGQLGDASEVSQTAVPVRVLVPEGVEFRTISLTTDASTALGSDGNVYTWGTGGYGPVFVPYAPPTLVPGGATTVTEVTFGGTPGTDLTYDGTRWTAQTPPGECGPVNVIVSYTQLGQDYSFVFPNRFTYGSAATITAQPASASITPGGTFSTSIAVEGDTPPTIQWQIQTGSTWEDLDGETAADLAATPERTSSYRAVVSNCLGSVTSETAVATVQAVASPGASPTPTNRAASPALAATGIDATPVLMVGAGLLALGLAVSAAAGIRRGIRLRR